MDKVLLDKLALCALNLVKREHGTYIRKCLFVNAVFSQLLTQAGVRNRLVSGKFAGGFNSGENDTFRYGYTATESVHSLDYHVWCVTEGGQVLDAMGLALHEEMQLNFNGEQSEYLLPKTSVVNSATLKSYDDIMDDYQLGVCYTEVRDFHQTTLTLVASFNEKHKQAIRQALEDNQST
ncbi:hypothetical protein VCHA53O466_140037 [Vibrio chagasii]|nr:hypothetical protein VCHA53O466_140037 [Vibrio chagasii]